MTNPNDPVAPGMTTTGLTKREYLAAGAMAGMIAGSQGLQITVKEFASQSVVLADALIAELNKGVA